MSGTSVFRGPKDEQRSIRITVHPWVEGSTVEISAYRRDTGGRSGGRIALWHLSLTRADLTGLGTDAVLRILFERFLCRLESGDNPADYRATAVGPGAPVGATGATVTRDPLPGL